MSMTWVKTTTIGKQQAAVIRFIRKQLGNTARKSGKVFYSSPSSLFAGGYILMGYNPGGDPASGVEHQISGNVNGWGSIHENHYWSERWTNHGEFNRLQKRVHALFDRLDVSHTETFTSNLWFLRSRDALTLKHSRAAKLAGVQIWKEFLARSPARKVICIGIRTGEEFLEAIGATEISRKAIATRHPRAFARLVQAKIQGNEYRIAALPHLSRFNVTSDPKLIQRIAQHFRMK